MLDIPTSTYDDGTDACYFNVDADPYGEATLGDSFMRSGYFVYDLENNVVAIAQANVNATSEDITAIPSGTSIPGCSSTNTLVISEAAVQTALGPMETQGGFIRNGNPGTPTFALGSAATATGSSSGGNGGSGGSGGSGGNGGGSGGDQGSAVSVRVGGMMATVVLGVVVGMCVL